jgi:diketogulonate reductase-like aldo/keto reductase
VRARAFGGGGPAVPVVGQGTWDVPTSGAARDDAVRALREGIELGMVHVDTAEMYGNGRAEEVVGEAIAGLPRERLFLVSKVLPENATFEGTQRACERSLRRMGTDYLDCYLLHWRGAHPLEGTMRALERLVDDGKIRSLGVSNFDVADLEEAAGLVRSHPIACNQVLYNLTERGIERRVLPYCARNGIALVGYSPFGQGGFPSPASAGGRALAAIAARHEDGPYAVALAFLVRLAGTFAIPKAARPAHVRENARGAALTLAERDLADLEAAFPLPATDGPLATA